MPFISNIRWEKMPLRYFRLQLGKLFYEGCSYKQTPLIPLLLTSANNAESNNRLHIGNSRSRSDSIIFIHYSGQN